MGHWFRGMFRTRSAPAVTEARAALHPPAPTPPEPDLLAREPSQWEWRRYVRSLIQAEAPPPPSVDEVQRRDAAEVERRTAAGVEHIVRGIARNKAWFPSDG